MVENLALWIKSVLFGSSQSPLFLKRQSDKTEGRKEGMKTGRKRGN